MFRGKVEKLILSREGCILKIMVDDFTIDKEVDRWIYFAPSYDDKMVSPVLTTTGETVVYSDVERFILKMKESSSTLN